MPQTALQILELLDVEPVGGDHFLGHHPASTTLSKAYGGQLLGQALAAAAKTVDVGRAPHSSTTHFLLACDHESPVEYRVERVRDGGSFSSRAVSAWQSGSEVLRVLASFQIDEDGFAHQAELEAIPSPADAVDMASLMLEASELSGEDWRHEWAGLQLRYVPGNLQREPGGPRTPGVQQMWVRVDGELPDDPAMHRLVIAYLSDLGLLGAALVPHGFMLGAPDVPRATMNHSMWFHDDARADEWLFIDQRSHWAGRARGLSTGGIYTGDGRLIATTAQEGLIRPRGAARERLTERTEAPQAP